MHDDETAEITEQEATYAQTFVDGSQRVRTIKTKSLETWSCNGIRVQAGTDCPKEGGCTAGTTLLMLEDLGGTQWDVRVDKNENGDDRITIWLLGNTEAGTLLEALEFAAATLRSQMDGV